MSNDISSKDSKLQKWASIIAEAKSSGIPLEQWTKEHNIPMSTYWYWHKKVTSELPDDPASSKPEFAELTLPAPSLPCTHVIFHKGDLSAEVSEDIDSKQIPVDIRAVKCKKV